jgi:pyrimidine deaminase RibD-like protein
VREAGSAAQGACAYLNIECGDCHGDDAAIKALICGGISRVVVGIRHPAPHHRHKAIQKLENAGVPVAVVGALSSAKSHRARALFSSKLVLCVKGCCGICLVPC